MKRFCAVVIVLFTAVVLIGSFSEADANSVLYGCAKIKSGKLRLVSDTGQCKKSEYPVTLNAVSGGGGAGLDLSQTYTRECFDTNACECDNVNDWGLQGGAKCSCTPSTEGRALTDGGAYPDVPYTYYAACWDPASTSTVEACVIRIRCVDAD